MFGVASFLAAGVGLLLLLQFPAFMIKAGLLFSVIVALIWTVWAFLSGSWFAGAIAVIFFLITLCYVRAVWSRIPFAAINMVTAGTAIKANLGVSVFAMFFTVLEIVWLVLWTIALMGVIESTEKQCNSNDACNVNYGFLFLLFVSVFFTQQVLQSCVHVTVAGTVGTWVSVTEKLFMTEVKSSEVLEALFCH